MDITDYTTKYCLYSVSKILNEVDVMGIVNENRSNEDEYGIETRMIFNYFVRGLETITEARVCEVVSIIFNLNFSLDDKDIIEKQEKFNLIAKKIKALGVMDLLVVKSINPMVSFILKLIGK